MYHLWSNFLMYSNTVRLRQLPAGSDMYNTLHYGVAVVVDEGQRPRLVGDGEGELVVVHETHLLNLAGIVHVVQQHRCVTQYLDRNIFVRSKTLLGK